MVRAVLTSTNAGYSVGVMETNIAILFHSNCFDGHTAAWVARKYFSEQGIKPDFFPCSYGKEGSASGVPWQEIADGKYSHVYILDFCLSREELLVMSGRVSLTVLDHHLSHKKALHGMCVRRIPLSDGNFAIVDEKDYDLVSKYSWSNAKHGGAIAYSAGRHDKSMIYMHKLILDNDQSVDHINRDPLDNRRANLRYATKQQNAANMDRGSEWKGVTKRRNKWLAQITVDGKNQYLGLFSTPEDAARAYDAAALEAFGEYARGNFIKHPEPINPPPQNLHIEFDMERSGAGLSWDHFYPDAPRPWIVDYVEDRDIWRHALPRSKTVNAYIMCQDRTWENWDRMFEMKLEEAINQGRGAEAYLNRYVRDMVKLSRRVKFPVRPNNPEAGFFKDIPVVNAPYIGTSELVGKLAENALFAVGWHQTASGMYYYSLRARGGFDVSELAKNFGGGGHAGAAGFLVSTRVHE